MYGLKQDWEIEPKATHHVLEDYSGTVPRWCSGCGDFAVLNAIQRLARDEQLPPEKTVMVSGIGCSSRLPHYMSTYGFHGLHGRALPIACGIRSRRPDLHIFVVTGDGDCCAIGTAHWIHAIRYNMNMTVLMLDNNIYGLTKMQSSPTTPQGKKSNTHPRGVVLPPLNPLSVTLGITNASFVAQTVDWNAAHVFATIAAAHKHRGLSFVRILQRCPHFMADEFTPLQDDPSKMMLLKHADGIAVDPMIEKLFKTQQAHDPADLSAARDHVAREDVVPVGLLYRNPDNPCYDHESAEGLGMSRSSRLEGLQAQIDQHLI
ncbi:MAG: thiamine pyrophosphate-dependent enzyme [Acidobacteriota bacterium]|nr:thiamine pyrophosphate-dependent enzyme [Acidobacteriota bacterium]MDH3785414.1 thiamine pyrophosphate-dependent enzyme [Acidobacteriota bacterium]